MFDLTDTALIETLKKTEESGSTDIRIGVTGGGCNGYEYVIQWCEKIRRDDHILDYGKFQIVIDNESLEYLKDAQLDWVTEGLNSFYKIINPLETASCGCGVSVSFWFKITIIINKRMDEVFKLIADVGAPIAGSIIMGVFIFIVIKQILAGIIDQIKTLTMFCQSLENRARTMSNEIIKIDLLVSSALDLPPDIDRIARAENFIEDGKLDVRRD